MKKILVSIIMGILSISYSYAGVGYDSNKQMHIFPACEDNKSLGNVEFLVFYCGGPKSEPMARKLEVLFDDFEYKLESKSDSEKIKIYKIVRERAQIKRLQIIEDDIYYPLEKDTLYREVRNESLYLRQLVLAMIENYMTHRIEFIEGITEEEIQNILDF